MLFNLIQLFTGVVLYSMKLMMTICIVICPMVMIAEEIPRLDIVRAFVEESELLSVCCLGQNIYQVTYCFTLNYLNHIIIFAGHSSSP